MKYEYVSDEQLQWLRGQPTQFVAEMLEANIELLNTVAESAEDECEAVGLRFINARFPKETRETIAAFEAELKRRRDFQ